MCACVCVCVCVCACTYAQLLHHVHLYEIPWTVAHQTPLSMWFSWQQYWSGFPFPSLRIFLTQRSIEPTSLASPALARGFFTSLSPENNISNVHKYVCSSQKMEASFTLVWGIMKKKKEHVMKKKKQCYFTKSITGKMYLCFNLWLSFSSVQWVEL